MTPTDQHKDTMVARTTEATLGWAKNAFFAGAHGGGFYFVVTQLQVGTFQYVTACIGGFIGILLWYGTAQRVRNLMSFWNDSLRLSEQAEADTIPVFGSERFRTIEEARLSGSRIFITLIILVGFAWLVIAASSILKIRWLWLMR